MAACGIVLVVVARVRPASRLRVLAAISSGINVQISLLGFLGPNYTTNCVVLELIHYGFYPTGPEGAPARVPIKFADKDQAAVRADAGTLEFDIEKGVQGELKGLTELPQHERKFGQADSSYKSLSTDYGL